MRLIGSKLSRCSVAAIALMTMAPTVGATVFVQETFDNYTAGSLIGKTAVATGLTGTYGLNGGGVPAVTVTSGGLVFGALNNASGNRVVFSSATNLSNVARVEIDLASSPSFTGTLYTSYLFNISARSGDTAGWAQGVGVSDTATGSAGSTGRFRTLVDSPTNANGATVYNPSASASTFAGSTPTANGTTTYLLVARFTNVGQALSAGAPGVATMWVLTEAQYNQAGGSLTDAYLDGLTVGVGAGQVFAKSTSSAVSGSSAFVDTNFLQLASVVGGGTAENVAYDRITIGDNLSAVTAVPEPLAITSFAVMTAAGALATRRRTS